ncbi:UBX domain-containing protein 1-like [Lineus longissimus]|uniref:UBX domain-containing protein 1-like n=1 Tax=Lineus longissimus TaxID=88925 RepID=UPI002B4EECCA
MSSDVDTLVEMGFPRNRAQRALHSTQFKGLQQAMDWMFAHENDADIDDPFELPKGNVLGKEEPKVDQPMEVEGEQGESSAGGGEGEGAATPTSPQQAMSLKCEDCGKLLRSENDVQMHAARTGHANFAESTEEIKPLTAEEKQAQLEKLQERLKAKREEKEAKEKQEAIAREKMRRQTGKEITEARQKLQDEELKRLAEIKRKEKLEEKLAKKKVLDDIERDKKNRAAQFAKEKNQASQPQQSASKPQPAAQPVKKDYDTCRIQITLTNGQRIQETFNAKEQLANVRVFVQTKRSDGDAPFRLMTNYPKKVFTDEDMEKPLTELGLVPSASLILTKPQ